MEPISELELPGRVLVVDDDQDSRELIARILKREGYEVREADGGQTAIDLLGQDGVDIDVILLDVMMPDMDGLTVCRELKKSAKTAGLPVILLTARDDIETRAAGMKLGVSEFLAKPVNKNDLFQRVRTQLEACRRVATLDAVQRRTDLLNP